MATATRSLSDVKQAVADEITRFNAKIVERQPFPLRIKDPNSLAHGQKVVAMRDDFWLITESNLGTLNAWCLCNDGRWARLLERAGVERNPLFATACYPDERQVNKNEILCTINGEFLCRIIQADHRSADCMVTGYDYDDILFEAPNHSSARAWISNHVW